MSFFDDFTKNASKVASKVVEATGSAMKTAAHKSADFAEINKMKMKISAEDKAVDDLYYYIGKKIYADCVADGIVPDSVNEECASVYSHKTRIAELQGKIELIRGENNYDNNAEDEVESDDGFDDSEDVIIAEVSPIEEFDDVNDDEDIKDDSTETKYGILRDVISDEPKQPKE